MPRTTIYRFSLGVFCALGLPAAVVSQDAKPSTHTVKKGDTLWDIAHAYMGDSFLWPQIYKLNTAVVEDPHWIYPGEVLLLVAQPGQTAVPAQDTPPPLQAQTAAAMRLDLEPAPMPQPVVDTPPAAPRGARITVVDPGNPGEGDEEGMELFRRNRVTSVANAFKTYREVKFHPLRSGEFYSAGFLTEADAFPFGVLLGPTTPEQIESSRSRAAVQIFTRVAVLPPSGASYAPGDTLVVVERREAPNGFGQMIVPTGLVRLTGQNGAQSVGEVIAVYGTIRDGQLVLPAEKFSDPGEAKYQAVSNGLEGHVLVARERNDIRLPQQVLFLDIGKDQGVMLGDLFEARRAPGPQPRATADAVDEVMATLQVVHVRGHTASVRVRNVVSPNIPPGTRVKLVAKLPS